MKRVSLVTLLLVLCFVGAQAQGQDNTIPGPVWRVSTYKVRPGKMNDVLMDLRQHFRVVNEEYKRQGVILDYKIYFNSTTDGPNDWDYAIATAYKNWAALDTLGPVADAATLKHYGSAEKRQQANDARNQLRDLVSSRLIREQTLKPLP
ncbi:MAG: hypothetical protein AUI33_15935 [Ignavibacteria bacterium 13_1_40CM_2_61_4]|nr:MAG: hypothetical protein AUI33_15935 [Ignavibacteria bacterium 13_1_40CM_2_61_4]